MYNYYDKQINLNASIFELSNSIRNKKIKSSDLLKYYFKVVEKYNPIQNSFITTLKGQAFKDAEIIEHELEHAKYRGRLHGIPFSIKDIIAVRNVPLTAGSKIYLHHISKNNSTIINRLKRAGSILIGTNNLNEFAAGITGKNIFFGNTKNPWDLNRISGGSSSGSAAAVAAGLVPYAIGTDTGGSTRVPSSLCGILGFKPTFNTISMMGVYKLAPSLDHIGIIAKNSVDISIVFTVIRKQKYKFPFFTPNFENKQLRSRTIQNIFLKNSKIIVIGIPQQFFVDYLETDIRIVFNKFVNLLQTDKFISINYVKIVPTFFFKTWQVVRLFEAYNIHKKLMKKHFKNYSTEVRSQLLKGEKIKFKDYYDAIKTIKKIRKQFLLLFTHIDFMLLPTTIITAPLFSDSNVHIEGRFFSIRNALLRNTFLFNSIGFPALTLPIGFSSISSMPIGLQIIAKPYDDYRLLMFSDYLEKNFKPI
jgi:aspartyl-tRNA(Asn)/glutamyl-tRNA(Gln) amidotransferase subunit A